MAKGVEYYHLAPHWTRTRDEQVFLRLRLESGAVAAGSPVSVSPIDSTSVRYLGFGSPLALGPSQPSDFWEYLRSLGGEWMWDGVEEEDQDLQWLVDGLKSGTIIAVTDSSYDRQVAPNISGAGIVLCCTSARRMLRANFYERSKSASSCRGKLLGLVALHTLLLALARLNDL